MPTSKDFSVEDEAYLATIAAEPKMTMDEVGADIEEHGHVPVTPETATQDPFTAKGSLAYALDEALSADTDLEKTIMTRDKNDNLDSHLTNPTDDFRDETKGEVEGTTSTPQGLIQPVESNTAGEGLEPTIQQDKAVQVKDSLAEALDAITMDGAEEIEAKPPIGKDPEPDLSKYNEEEASHIPLKAPKVPPSLGGADDTPDANGLVYVTRTFVVDPTKYVSNNYRPSNMGKMPDAVAKLKKASGAMKKQSVNPEEESELSDLGSPEDEPTDKQEEAAAKEADKKEEAQAKGNGSASIEEVVVEEKTTPIPNKKQDKDAEDEAPEKVVLDYATFLDGSSFICCDEINGIDYSVITMDARPRRAPTRQSCQTTFAQCRAENPLFCRFHGPKLLEADIRTALRAQLRSTLGNAGANGMVINVTKDRDSDNPMKFRVTVGCSPAQKPQVEHVLDEYFRNNPGITSHDNRGENSVGDLTQEFEMDILRADEPPENSTFKARKANEKRNEAVEAGRQMEVVGETPENPTPLRRNARARRTQRQLQAEQVETGNTEPQVLPSPQPQQAERQGESQNTNPAEGTLQATQGGEEGASNQRNYEGHAGSQRHGEVFQPQQNPSEQEEPRPDNGIVHNEGGVKAPFSQSEIRALERELGRAIEDATNNPDDADKQAYFHALSHFMGSANSRYGRRNNALQGIRDGITKADLLAKAQRRLETTVDADNMTRYNGSVRALETIAEIGGLHGLEIDGANISLAHPELDGQMPQREEEPQGAAEPNEGENGEQNVDVQQQADQPNSRQNAFTNEEVRRAAEELVNNGADYDIDAAIGDIDHLVNYLSLRDNGFEQTDRDDARRILEDINREGNERLYDRLREIAGVNEQNGEATGGEQGNNNQQPEQRQEAPTQQAQATEAQQPQQAQTAMPTEEDLRHAVERIQNDNLNVPAELRSVPSDRLVRELSNRLNGRTRIGRDELSMLDSVLPPSNVVREALHAAYDRQELVARQNREATQGSNTNSAAAEPQRTRTRRRRTNLSAEEAVRNVPQPNYEATSPEEIDRINRENEEWWTSHTKDDALREIMMVNSSGLNDAVREADTAVANDAMPEVMPLNTDEWRTIENSQTSEHGCNCWKTVVGVLLRLRGFKVKARTQDERSPVFEGTAAESGGQKITFMSSQLAMSRHYERVNQLTGEATKNKMLKILMGDANGHPPIKPYPDGTFITSWNGGHCTGIICFKGRAFRINPFYGTHNTGASSLTGGELASSIERGMFCGDHTYNGYGGYGASIREALRSFERRREEAAARGERFQYPRDTDDDMLSFEKQCVFSFKRMQMKLRRTNPNVTDAEVIEACRTDEENFKLNGSFVIRPDEPLCREMFGLCRPSRV